MPEDPFSRITIDPQAMGGRPCIRGLRITVGTIVAMHHAGHSEEAILQLYPYLEPADIHQAILYAAAHEKGRSIT